MTRIPLTKKKLLQRLADNIKWAKLNGLDLVKFKKIGFVIESNKEHCCLYIWDRNTNEFFVYDSFADGIDMTHAGITIEAVRSVFK